MKRAVADAYTVGQDLSSNMVRYARSRLDEVHCGDCRQPAIADNSVDVVFCRCDAVCNDVLCLASYVLRLTSG